MSSTARTLAGMAPRCTGMCSAWATISPSRSNTAAEQSARSLMFGEYAARSSATPISSATPASACRNTSSSTAVMSAIEAHHQVPGVVQYGHLAVTQQGGGVRLLDQRWAGDLIPGREPCPGDHPCHAEITQLPASLRGRLALIPLARRLG